MIIGALPGWGFRRRKRSITRHRMGIVHRDIKPANLLVDTHDNLWVTDLGWLDF